VIQRRSPTQIRRRGIDGHGSELESISNRIVGDKGEDVGREVQHHQVPGVLLSHQPAGEQREAGLHEKHEISSVEGPGKIGGHPDVARRVGELHGKRLLGRLSLELIGLLFALRVIGSGLVDRFGDDEGVSASVNQSRLVTCGDACWIRLRSLLPHAWHRQDRYAAGGKHQHANAFQKRLAESLTARSFCVLLCLHNSLSCLRLVYSNH
jgi:hypothetical protein